MLFKLDFTVTYAADMSQRDLFTIWAEEADTALGAKEAGVVDVDGPDTLDQILFDLPIMQKMSQHVDVQVKSIRRYEDFAADVKSRLSA